MDPQYPPDPTDELAWLRWKMSAMGKRPGGVSSMGSPMNNIASGPNSIPPPGMGDAGGATTPAASPTPTPSAPPSGQFAESRPVGRPPGLGPYDDSDHPTVMDTPQQMAQAAASLPMGDPAARPESNLTAHVPPGPAGGIDVGTAMTSPSAPSKPTGFSMTPKAPPAPAGNQTPIDPLTGKPFRSVEDVYTNDLYPDIQKALGMPSVVDQRGSMASKMPGANATVDPDEVKKKATAYWAGKK
jgi:hypothetical protein